MLAHPNASSLSSSAHESPSSPLFHKSPTAAREEGQRQPDTNLENAQNVPGPAPKGKAEAAIPDQTAGSTNAESKSGRESADPASNLLFRASPAVSENDEEAVVYGAPRMLQDPTGRLCKLTRVHTARRLFHAPFK